MSLAYLVSDDFPAQVFVNPMPAAGVKRPRRTRKAAAPSVKVVKTTRADLVALCEEKGLRVLAAHTKTELELMLVKGENVRPAAYDRQNAKRKAARAVAAE